MGSGVSLFDLLGLRRPADDAALSSAETASVRAIAARLEGLEPGQARLVAAFAMVLARVARADLEVSEVETRSMEQALAEFGGLDPENAVLAAEMASHHNALRGTAEDYLATREFRDIASPEDKLRLLHCLFAVSAADDSISLVEEEEVRQVASELGLDHQAYVTARGTFRDKREVLKGLRRSSSRG